MERTGEAGVGGSLSDLYHLWPGQDRARSESPAALPRTTGRGAVSAIANEPRGGVSVAHMLVDAWSAGGSGRTASRSRY